MTNKQDDKKLIELAANLSLILVRDNWSPLDNNEDAFKLADDCAFIIEVQKDAIYVSNQFCRNLQHYDSQAGDMQATVRKAITKAAAEYWKWLNVG